MSDLLSPLYVVFEANEGDAFWGLVGVMKMMVSACCGAVLTRRSRISCATSPG
jgi:hypothetical protein